MIEYGAIAWTAFFAVMYRGSQRFELRVMMMFVNVMLLTDNTLIYPYVIFAIGVACQNLLRPAVAQVADPDLPLAGTRPARRPRRWSAVR